MTESHIILSPVQGRPILQNGKSLLIPITPETKQCL